MGSEVTHVDRAHRGHFLITMWIVRTRPNCIMNIIYSVRFMTLCYNYSTHYVTLFYFSVHQAQSAVKIGLEKLKEHDIPISRPEDCFLEVVKSNDHMRKVCVVEIF